ncbi:MAG: PEGA domain-containing protein, partial [Candidatus Krumholzibacteria bacterium]|nr:PEGA domain-containing protein [Candidatus Krumholzibacteria bacterium]
MLIDMQSMAITSDADFLGKVAQAIMTSGYEFSDSHLSTYFLEQKDNPYDAFDRFIKRLAEDLGDTKLVLTFDEYELFETNFDNNVLKTQVLRLVGNLIEHKRLFVVFTGSDKLEARNRKYWDILSKGLNRRISFLSRNDTLRLVREPLRGVIEYDQGVPEAIADLTAGQPFYTQVLCQTIVDHLNEEQKYDVNNEDLERVVNEVIVNPLPQMIFHWNQLPFLEKLCLSFIAEICRQESMPVTAADIAEFAQKENLGYQIDVNGLKKALENLFKGDLLVKSAEADKYEFKMGLWRLWITRMHSMWQVVDEMERAGKIPPELTRPEKPNKRRWAYVSAAVIMVAAAAVIIRGLIPGDKGEIDSSRSLKLVEQANINIKSTPDDAEVWIDGVKIGWTPLNYNIKAGMHRLEVKHAGYMAFVDSFDIEAFTSWEAILVLEVLTGNIDVQSTPSWARNFLNGEDTGLRT